MNTHRNIIKAMRKALPVFITIAGILTVPSAIAALPNSPTLDYTRVDLIPDRVGYWLGPLGVRALKHDGDGAQNLEAQMQVTIVEEGSPADGLIQPGDVILGVNGKTLGMGDPRRPICLAIIEVENEGGELPVQIWRPATKAPFVEEGASKKRTPPPEPAAQRVPGKELTVSVPLAKLGRYSDTSPWDCPRSAKIIENGIRFIREKDPAYGALRINFLALLATGEKEHIEFAKEKMLEHKLDQAPEDLHLSMLGGGKDTWALGYGVIVMAEYTMLTGDQTFVPALKVQAKRLALSQDDNGLWYHNLYMPYGLRGRSEGRAFGYGPVNASGLGCLTGTILAKKAGVDDPDLDLAVERGTGFYREFVGNGRIGYGFSPPIPGEASNGKNSIAAVLFGIHGDYPAMRYFSKCSLVDRKRTGGHCGNYLNQLWGGLGANIGTPEGSINYHSTRRWYETSVRGWDGSFRYQYGNGTAYNERSYNADTGAYLLSHLTPRRAIYVTGKGVPEKEYLSDKELGEALQTARYFLEKEYRTDEMIPESVNDLSDDQVTDLLGNWATGLRERAGYVLMDRMPADLAERVTKALESGNPDLQLGAAYLFKNLAKNERRLPPEVNQKRNALAAELEPAAVKCILTCGSTLIAEELAIGVSKVEPAQVAQLGELLGTGNPKNLHYLMMRSTSDKSQAKASPLEVVEAKGIDPKVLLNAARMNSLRGGQTYNAMLTKHVAPEDMVMMLEPLLRTAEFDTNIYSTSYFRAHRIEEARDIVADAILNRKGNKIWNPLEATRSYGGHLKGILPELRRRLFSNDPRRTKDIEIWRKAIEIIEKDPSPPPMMSIREILKADLDKRIQGKTREQLVGFLREMIVGSSSSDQIYQGLLLEKYAETDPEGALDFLKHSLGPGDNFREKSAISAGARYYPPELWTESLGSKELTDLQKSGVLRILHEKKKAIPTPVLTGYLDSESVEMRKVSIGIIGETGGEAEATLLAEKLLKADRTLTPAYEAAIGAIHARKPLSDEFFRKLSSDLLATHVNPESTPDMILGDHMRTAPIPGAAGLRILHLAGSPRYFEGFAGSRTKYSELIGEMLLSINPLKLKSDGKVDEEQFKGYAPKELINYFLPEMEMGNIDPRFRKPIAEYLLSLLAKDMIGEFGQYYKPRLEAILK